jgi:PPP family 3-phenylpropionic acid transporter
MQQAAAGRVRLATWYFLFIGALGALAPYLAICLKNAGASGTQTGAVLALIPLGLLIGSPLGTLLADRSGKPTWVLRVCVAISVLATGWLLLAPDWRWMAPAAALLALARSPAGAITDNLAVQMTSGGNYGRVRLWGSVGFVLACAGVGWGLDRWPTSPIVVCLVLLALLLAVTHTMDPRAVPSEPSRRSLSVFLAQKPLAALYGVAVLHSATVAIYDRFFALHISEIGLPSSVAGTAIALGVAVEVGVMAAAPFLLRRLGPLNLILLGIGAGIPRWWLCGVVEDAGLLVAVQALHGLSFGAWWIGGIALIARHAPAGLRNSAQGIFLAAGHGVGQLLAMLGAAAILDRVSTGDIFRGLSLISLVALVLALMWLAPALRDAKTHSRGERL